MAGLGQFAGGRANARARHANEARRETHRKLAAEVKRSDRERVEGFRKTLDNLEPDDYLQRLSYDRDENALPLRIEVNGHNEECKCTLYDLKCFLGTKGEPGYLDWRCSKRLCDLREELHDPLKEALGPVYNEFGETPFAKFGGLPGTTARLVDWFRTLADFINAGFASPAIVALVLRFLCTPMPGGKRSMNGTVVTLAKEHHTANEVQSRGYPSPSAVPTPVLGMQDVDAESPEAIGGA